MTRTILCFLFLFCCVSSPGTVSGADAPFTRLVTAPTAASIPSRGFLFDTVFFEDGGVTEVFEYGLTDLVDVGVSYGGARVIGSSRISWQPHVGIRFRVRVVEETLRNPAVAVGFDSQGEGAYLGGEKLNRFQIKSRGLYVAASRNYRMLGHLGFHAGAAYSFETADGDSDPTFWCGVNKSVGRYVELCGEYDFATNDNEHDSMKVEHGYLNLALKLSLGGVFTVEFDVKNMLRNERRDVSGEIVADPEPTREVRLFYRGGF